TERNFDLEAPSGAAALDAFVPDPVPLPVLAVGSHQRIGHRTRWIGLEEIPSAAIEKRVDRPLNLVVLLKKFIPALLIARQVLGGFGVVTDDAQVERVAVEGNAEFSLFGRRSAVVGSIWRKSVATCARRQT